jgi:hypothetical protein
MRFKIPRRKEPTTFGLITKNGPFRLQAASREDLKQEAIQSSDLFS